MSTSISQTAWQVIIRQWHTIFAVMLRDIKTRFFGSGWGYLLYICWPFGNIIIVVLMLTLSGRVAPYGTDMFLFAATGTTPFMCFSYASRFLTLSIIMNKPLLSFPNVKPLDIIIARALLEALTACLNILMVVLVLAAVGSDWVPNDVPEAFYAAFAAIALGVGFGSINAIIAAGIQFYATVYALITIILWATAGIVFVPDTAPEPLRVVLSYIPTVQIVEWMRSAYYPNYGSLTLDKYYLWECVLSTLFGGLLLERMVRGKLLQ